MDMWSMASQPHKAIISIQIPSCLFVPPDATLLQRVWAEEAVIIEILSVDPPSTTLCPSEKSASWHPTLIAVVDLHPTTSTFLIILTWNSAILAMISSLSKYDCDPNHHPSRSLLTPVIILSFDDSSAALSPLSCARIQTCWGGIPVKEGIDAVLVRMNLTTVASLA